MKIYLDPNGNDAFDGLTPEKAVASPAAAACRAREHHAESVQIAGGDYFLSEPLKLGPENSGQTWAAADGAHPRLIGAIRLTGWTKHDELRNIWRTELNAPLRSRDLFINGERAIRAKSKNLTAVAFTDEGILFSEKNLPCLVSPRDVEAVLINYWNQPRIGGRSLEHTKSGYLLRMKQPGWRTYMETASLGGAPAEPGQFRALENALEFLTEPGEWCFNSRTDEVFAIPREGVDLNAAECLLGTGEALMILDGAENMTFRGLTFTGTTWLQSAADDGLVTIQANFRKGRAVSAETRWDERNWIAPAAAIRGDFCRGVVFENDSFLHLGTGGLHLGRAARDCRVSRCLFRDCAGTAVTIGAFKNIDRHPERIGSDLYADGNLVENNLIEHIGVDSYAAGVGLCAGYVRNTVFTHNTIAHMPYSGISFGWGWAWGGAELANRLTGNRITNNRIYDVMNVLFDGGGIYMLGRMDGLLVEGNYISEVNNDYGAIYLDNGCQGFTVRNNVIRASHRNYIYKGDRHRIAGNYAEKSLVQPDLPMPELCDEHHPDLIFEDNYRQDEAVEARIMRDAGVQAAHIGA
ncbi:MAG: right-handed parallel beta-helix repeat-containing protein [Eubacteriales bacterium]|nr:right-handed parallel beta-helix repeat-containing protein [Eubacteriales bacterium]